MDLILRLRQKFECAPPAFLSFARSEGSADVFRLDDHSIFLPFANDRMYEKMYWVFFIFQTVAILLPLSQWQKVKLVEQIALVSFLLCPLRTL